MNRPGQVSALSTLDDELPTVADQRHVEPAKLSRLFRGELDWVVMKALEKDRSRRYETALALAEDVGRFLRNDLVLARPPSFRYRAEKYLVAATSQQFPFLLFSW